MGGLIKLVPSVGKVLSCQRGVAKFCIANCVHEAKEDLVPFGDIVVDADDVFAHVGGHREGLDKYPFVVFGSGNMYIWIAKVVALGLILEAGITLPGNGR